MEKCALPLLRWVSAGMFTIAANRTVYKEASALLFLGLDTETLQLMPLLWIEGLVEIGCNSFPIECHCSCAANISQ